MLELLPNSILDDINKGLGLTQALAKEGLKFIPGNEDVGFILHLWLVLLPAKQSGILEDVGGKLHPILTLCPGGSKMVFTLLEKIIVL